MVPNYSPDASSAAARIRRAATASSIQAGSHLHASPACTAEANRPADSTNMGWADARPRGTSPVKTPPRSDHKHELQSVLRGSGRSLGKERRKIAPELEEVKLQVAQANRVLSDVGLAAGVTLALGHASMRVPSQPDRFVVKGREYSLDALAVIRAEDMVVCDTEGFLVDGPPGITQCSEVKIHSCIYKTRPDVQSVVHVHPRLIVLLSVLRIPLVPMC